jgi:hypothetical protein
MASPEVNNMIKIHELCGPVSHEEAREIAMRYINQSFRNEGKPRPLHSIPANPRTDSDLRLCAYIEQQRLKEAPRETPPCPLCDSTEHSAYSCDCGQ